MAAKKLMKRLKTVFLVKIWQVKGLKDMPLTLILTKLVENISVYQNEMLLLCFLHYNEIRFTITVEINSFPLVINQCQ